MSATAREARDRDAKGRVAETAGAASSDADAARGRQSAGKKGPTPTRREREAQNLRPLVPTDRKQAKREAAAASREKQSAARAGAMRGEDRYLRPNERGPQKRFMRDVVDARFSFGELLMPLMLVIILTNFLGDNLVALIAMAVIWAYVILCVIEGVLVGRSVRRRIAAVVGHDRVERGIILGTITRGLYLRFLRMPRPQVPRGAKVEFRG